VTYNQQKHVGLQKKTAKSGLKPLSYAVCKHELQTVMLEMVVGTYYNLIMER
jgi:hypothetical protein